MIFMLPTWSQLNLKSNLLRAKQNGAYVAQEALIASFNLTGYGQLQVHT